jgi:urease accessory protein UreF
MANQMPRTAPKAAPLYIAAALIFCAASSSVGHAREAPQRDAMEQCVENLMVRLGRLKAPESQVGQEVVSRCDRELHETLAEAIRSGEAPFCSVETCLELARMRAAKEAREEYRERFLR